MAIDDAGGLEWAHTTSCDPLVRQPSAELSQRPPLGRIELQSGPPRRPIQLLVELFPVKHAAYASSSLSIAAITTARRGSSPSE